MPPLLEMVHLCPSLTRDGPLVSGGISALTSWHRSLSASFNTEGEESVLIAMQMLAPQDEEEARIARSRVEGTGRGGESAAAAHAAIGVGC
jgi:hypothetical protein